MRHLLALHGLDQLEQLGGVGDFHKRPRGILAADHIDRRRVLDANFAPQFLVGGDLGRELALRIDDERQVGLVIGSKLLRETLQVIRRYFRLVLENVVAELVAEIFALSVEVARDDRSIERPVVHWQRKVMSHERYLVRLCRLLLQWRVASAFGTLQVLKHNQRYWRAFWRPEQRGVLGQSERT